MKASKCIITVNGMTLLEAKELDHQATRKILGGLGGVVFSGTVEEVQVLLHDLANRARLEAPGKKHLEITLKIF